MKKPNQVFRTTTLTAAPKLDTLNFHNSNVDSVVALIGNRNPSQFRTVDMDAKFDTSSSASKTVDDLWKELKEEAVGEMILEGFLQAKPQDQDVRILNPFSCLKDFDRVYVEEETVGFGNGVDISGRGKRRRAAMEPMDEAALQRQRRMIKNRESAARSRERKQAHQVELELIASRLEEENELLLKEKAERSKERLKQLMEKVIPVVEKQRLPRVICWGHSFEW